jgi:hypothetical protein
VKLAGPRFARPRNEQRGAIVTGPLLVLAAGRRNEEHAAAYQATRRSSSLTSTSLQDVHDMTIKGERPSGRGTVRTSRIMPPQEAQRAIARLSAKIMVANPKNERDRTLGKLIAESPVKMVAEKPRGQI